MISKMILLNSKDLIKNCSEILKKEKILHADNILEIMD